MGGVLCWIKFLHMKSYVDSIFYTMIKFKLVYHRKKNFLQLIRTGSGGEKKTGKGRKKFVGDKKCSASLLWCFQNCMHLSKLNKFFTVGDPKGKVFSSYGACFVSGQPGFHPQHAAELGSKPSTFICSPDLWMQKSWVSLSVLQKKKTNNQITANYL